MVHQRCLGIFCKLFVRPKNAENHCLSSRNELRNRPFPRECSRYALEGRYGIVVFPNKCCIRTLVPNELLPCGETMQFFPQTLSRKDDKKYPYWVSKLSIPKRPRNKLCNKHYVRGVLCYACSINSAPCSQRYSCDIRNVVLDDSHPRAERIERSTCLSHGINHTRGSGLCLPWSIV